MKFITRAFALLLVVGAALGASAFAQHGTQQVVPQSAAHAAPMRTAPWPAESVKLAESLPIQDGGRIKPLETYASFLMLRLNGKRSTETPSGEKLGPSEWMLDLLFFPEASETYPVFIAQDSAAIEAIGLNFEGKKKRDHYSFQELQPGISKLFELARQYSAIEEKERNSVQQQVFLLANNVNDYMQVLTHLDFTRHLIPIGESAELARMFDGAHEASFSQVLAHVPDLRVLQAKLSGDPQRAEELKTVTAVLRDTFDLATSAESLAFFPPSASVASEPAWLTPSDLLEHTLQGQPVAPVHMQMLGSMEAAAKSAADPASFTREFSKLRDLSRSLAATRGEDAKLDLELAYHKSELLSRSQIVFVLGFLFAAVLWMRPRTKWLYYAASGAVALAALLLIGAIVMRCMIRGRPPVSTLYETVLFVTAVGTTIALIAEWINRQRIALSAAAVLGMIGIFVANGYETLDKRDTMPSLVAVLDTNFWLATHVTAITVGYSAGVLAALLANIYLVTKIFGVKKKEPAFHRGLGRTVYGVLCFGLIFSTVGTILGGVWANESWGRFWGWDPKENGALLIVITEIAILHGRMSGWLREFGLCMAAAFAGSVVAFSWWGVNLLGVGLHSYGFTSGIHTALWTYYGIQWSLIAVAGIHLLIERSRAKAVREALAEAGRTSFSDSSA